MKLKLLLINNEYDLVRAEPHKGDGTGIFQSSGRELFASTGNLMDIPMLDKSKIEEMLGIIDVEQIAIQKVGLNWLHLFDGNRLVYKRPIPTMFWRDVDMYISGYNEAKKKSEAYFEEGWVARAHQLQDNGWHFDESWSGNELLKYYQQLHEWDVEVEMEAAIGSVLMKGYSLKPKVDEKGYIIITKIHK